MASADIFVGTAEGLFALRSGDVHLAGHEVKALARADEEWWAVGAKDLWRSTGDGAWQDIAGLEGGLVANCVLPSPAGVLVGTSEARLFRLEGNTLSPVDGFDVVEGRNSWYTPWGGPPDSRSAAQDTAGTLFVNVHVGGIPKSTDGGATWLPTIDIDSDVHQVLAHPEQPGRILAACAWGFAESRDSGGTWTITDDGLHASYCRAVAISGDAVLLSASTSHRGERAALYRRPLDADGPFERCTTGLPDWFDANVDTHWLVSDAERAAFASPDGRIYVSEDAGATWTEAASGLDGVRCVALA